MNFTAPWKMTDRIDRYMTYAAIFTFAYSVLSIVTGWDFGLVYVIGVFGILGTANAVRSVIQIQIFMRRFKAEKDTPFHELPPHRQEDININRAKRVLAAKYPEGR